MNFCLYSCFSSSASSSGKQDYSRNSFQDWGNQSAREKSFSFLTVTIIIIRSPAKKPLLADCPPPFPPFPYHFEAGAANQRAWDPAGGRRRSCIERARKRLTYGGLKRWRRKISPPSYSPAPTYTTATLLPPPPSFRPRPLAELSVGSGHEEEEQHPPHPDRPNTTLSPRHSTKKILLAPRPVSLLNPSA